MLSNPFILVFHFYNLYAYCRVQYRLSVTRNQEGMSTTRTLDSLSPSDVKFQTPVRTPFSIAASPTTTGIGLLRRMSKRKQVEQMQRLSKHVKRKGFLPGEAKVCTMFEV